MKEKKKTLRNDNERKKRNREKIPPKNKEENSLVKKLGTKEKI